MRARATPGELEQIDARNQHRPARRSKVRLRGQFAQHAVDEGKQSAERLPQLLRGAIDQRPADGDRQYRQQVGARDTASLPHQDRADQRAQILMEKARVAEALHQRDKVGRRAERHPFCSKELVKLFDVKCVGIRLRNR